MASTPESIQWQSDLLAKVLTREIGDLREEIEQLQSALTVLADRGRPVFNGRGAEPLPAARSLQAEASFVDSLHRLSHCVAKLSDSTL